MIAFSCSHCGTMLKVKPEFAGRQSKCPGCKQPLVVPPPSATIPFVPPQQIDGTESSLAKACITAGVSLGQHDTSQLPSGGKPLATGPLAGRKSGKERYLIEGEIARGGMGAVLRAVDCDLRREIAVKYMLDAKDLKKQARFVEEAQINSQLEHPNIVPVYDLGIDAQKRPFIMMKMVKGRSLKDVLDKLRDHPKQAEKEYTLGRLLNILVNVCNALAFAHSRGVIHRDLKPANIMLGDFGEVYVMDWGLAKVLGHQGQASEDGKPGPTIAYEPNQQVTTSRSGKSADADLTQEGSVIGTPAYMPPEQATGNLQAIDARSDVYSLGAILYEMLTLQPPVDKEGGYLSVLMRVMEGEIIPPEQRDPKRTKAGMVPKELAAVAMKAMAKDTRQRYATVEELRKDIERFQEGRSVSAKVDSNWELIWKLVKRNKGASAGVAVAVGILLTSLVLLFQAWQRTEAASTALATKQTEKEQAEKEKREQMIQSVPTMLEAARYFVNQRKYKSAADQVKMALEYDPANADAHLFTAEFLLGEKKFDGAKAELAECLRLQPQHPQGRSIAAALQKGKPDDAWVIFALADEMSREQLHGLSAILLESAGELLEARKKLGDVYRAKLEGVWPRVRGNLRVEGNGQIVLDLSAFREQVADLKPLQGMKINWLSVADCRKVQDLEPLRGMPLNTLTLGHCIGIKDLEPLKGMKLMHLDIGLTAAKDLSPLRDMPLIDIHLPQCKNVHDLTPLNMPLKAIWFDVGNVSKASIEHVRTMKSLDMINRVPASEFWRKYNAGEIK